MSYILQAKFEIKYDLFPIADAYTVDDVVYNWKNPGSNAIEVFVTELAQYDLLNITTSKKASTNSKGWAI